MIINVLKIIFKNELRPHEVGQFRGAVINALRVKNVLFHNHEGDGFRYDYPLIQYKIIGGKAAMVCVGEGANVVGEFFASSNFDVVIGDRSERLELERTEPQRFNVQVWEQRFDYRLRRWVALNGENYKRYRDSESLAERCLLLESVLKGNILSMGKGLGIEFDRQIECAISSVEEPYAITVKGVKMMSFNVDFACNVSLPTHIGLGKHASLNCGIVHAGARRKKEDTEQSI